MNKREIAEIKKQLTVVNCCITRICGCLVDAEKEKKSEFNKAFLTIPEEEMFKYFEIFKKTLSGSIGKNLMNMEFPLSQETDGGTQRFLLGLRNSKLQDQELIDAFFDKIIERYDYSENYYIILVHAAYDIPGKTSDNMEMEDASDEVYEHLICSICPVKLSKSGLIYNPETNIIENRIRDWTVEMPQTGFLFPVFNDRSSDIHGILYYSKNAEKLHSSFVEGFLGCEAPVSAKGQKESFQNLVDGTLGDNCTYDVVSNIHEKLNKLIEKKSLGMIPLSSQDMK